MKIYTLILLLSLTTIWFYVGFIRKSTEYYLLPRIRGAFFVFFMLSLIMTFVVFKEAKSKNEISDYIIPYKGDMEAIYVPPVPGNVSQMWMFKTDDSPKQVRQFYSDRKNLQDWELVSGFPFMAIKKDQMEIRISVTASGKTLITYELRNTESYK